MLLVNNVESKKIQIFLLLITKCLCDFSLCCLFMRVNIVIVSNGLNGFRVCDVRKWMLLKGESFILDSAPCVYLYYHVHKRSFEKSTHCNHFAYMELTIAEENDAHVYENNSVQEANRVDLDSDGDEDIGFMDTDSNANKKNWKTKTWKW